MFNIMEFLWSMVEGGLSFLLIISSVLTLVYVVLLRWFKPLLVAFPIARVIGGIAALITFAILALKTWLFIAGLISAQAELGKLRKELSDEKGKVTNLQQTDGRKETQASSIAASDAKANVIYVDKWRTIEKVVTKADLSLANQLALDLTVNFYKPETSDASSPIIK